MLMGFSQPSPLLTLLLPLDKEAVRWWHVNVLGGDEWKAPYPLPPDKAMAMLQIFTEAGGTVASH